MDGQLLISGGNFASGIASFLNNIVAAEHLHSKLWFAMTTL